MTRLPHTLPVLAGAFALAFAAPALASSADVIRDCAQDGRIDGDYSSDDLREAESDLPTDIDEYTDCREAIRAARLGGPGAGSRDGGAGGAGGGDPALTTESGAVAGAKEDIDALRTISATATDDSAPRELSIGPRRIAPGTGGLLGVADTANEIPLPLALTLTALAALAALATWLVLGRRFPQLRRAALRILRR